MVSTLFAISFIILVISILSSLIFFIKWIHAKNKIDEKSSACIKVYKQIWLSSIILVLVFFKLTKYTAHKVVLANESVKSTKVSKKTDSSDEDTDNDSDDNTVGDTIDEDEVKDGPDDDYYVDKTDHKIRYFVDDDDTITAAKVVFTPDSANTISVQNYLSERLLNDEHLKYTNSKKSEDDILLDSSGKYNVYSPDNDEWYHISIQSSSEGDDRVSEFSVWPGKSKDSE